MSEWEARRKQSWGYYLCFLVLLWPILLIPIQYIFAPYSLVDALAGALISSVLVVGLAVGCGTRYRFRGINPGSRVVLSSIDDQYLQTSDPDISNT